MVNIKIGDKYVIVVNSGQALTFIAVIVSQDNNFITFTDIKNNTYTFNKNVIVSLTPYKENYKKEGNGDDN